MKNSYMAHSLRRYEKQVIDVNSDQECYTVFSCGKEYLSIDEDLTVKMQAVTVEKNKDSQLDETETQCFISEYSIGVNSYTKAEVSSKFQKDVLPGVQSQDSSSEPLQSDEHLRTNTDKNLKSTGTESSLSEIRTVTQGGVVTVTISDPLAESDMEQSNEGSLLGDKQDMSHDSNISFVSSNTVCTDQIIEVKPFECGVCNITFNARKYLETHMRIHTGEKPYRCDICSRCFSQCCNLYRHIRTHIGDRRYKCNMCAAGFMESSDLQKHMTTHTEEKPYRCDICGWPFSEMSDIGRHKQLHTDKDLHRCDICYKAFSSKCDLQRHERIHTGEKPWKCDVCGASFTLKHSLQLHERTHTRLKPYQCEVCGKCFSQRCGLRTHKRTHTGEKPWKCDFCGKRFNQKINLQTHNRKHSGEKK